MSLSLVDDLLDQAEYLATREGKGRPKQASLRRAVSAAYYALFHEIADMAVTQALGVEEAKGPVGARLRRSVQHRSVKAAAQWMSGSAKPKSLLPMLAEPAPRALAVACRRFVKLQQERHRADYDLASPFSRDEVRLLVHAARDAVRALRALESSRTKTIFLLGCLLGAQLTSNA